jgi:hypothetical protein
LAGSAAWLVGMGALMPADLLIMLGALPVPEPLDHTMGGSVVASLL